MRIKLAVERLRRNQTQKIVAEATGITSQMLSDYELGKTTPTLNTMLKIARYYGKSIEELFNQESEENV